MILSLDEKRSLLWKRLREYLTAEIAKLREENDNPTSDDSTTKHRRGRIDQLKKLLALEEGTPAEEDES